MNTILKIVIGLLVTALVSIYLGSLAVWYWANLYGNPPYNAPIILWQQGSAQHRAWLINGSLMVFAVLTILAALIFGKWYLKQRSMVYGRSKLAGFFDVKKAGLFNKQQGIFLGYFNNRPLFDSTQQHVSLIAESGTGKGVSLIIPNLFLWSGSVIVSDMKGENFALTSGYRAARGQSCYCFDPFSNTTHRINPLSYLDERNPIDHLQRISYVIYPDPEGKEALWSSGSRQLFMGLALLLLLEQGKAAVTFINILSVQGTLDLEKVDARIHKLSGNRFLIDSCWQLLREYADTPDKTRGGIKAEFRSKLDIFLNPPVAWATSGNDVPLDQLRKSPITLYLSTSPSNIARVSFLMRVILETVNMLHTQEEFKANPEHRYELLLLNDEQHNFYGNLPLMLKAASFYRSYGIRIFSVYQSVAQIKIDYGDNGARAYLDNHNIRIHYCPTDQRKAREFATEIGETTIFTKSRSTGGQGRASVSEAPQKREAFLPEELIKMLGQKYGLLFVGGSRPIRFRKAIWYKEKTFRERQLPPVALPTADQRTMESFLGKYMPSFSEHQMTADPVAALCDMVSSGASEENINELIDKMIIKGHRA